MTDEKRPARFNVKGFTSLVLMIAFLVLDASGIVLFIGPHGRVAHSTGWTLLGLDKGQWMHLHLTTALLFLMAALFHLIWNWGMFWGYIKKKAARGLNLKLEMAVALVIGVLLVGGTIMDVQPFRGFVQLKRTIGNSWAVGDDEHGSGQGMGQGRGRGGGQGQGRGMGQGRQYRGGN